MHDSTHPPARNSSHSESLAAALVEFYASGHGNAANDLLEASESILEREPGEEFLGLVSGPADVASGGASGTAAAPPPTMGQNGSKTPPSFLIHEDKTGSPCEVRTYEPISERVGRYSKHHRRALEMARFCESIAPHRAEKLRTCGAFLQFRDYYTLEQVRLTSACFCQQDRLCGLCACRRGGRLLRSYVERTQAVLREHPNLRPYFVTLTVKDGPDLGERVTHLLKSVKRLGEERGQYIRDCRKGNRPTFLPVMACAAAGVGSCEVKRGSGSGLWHPHWHAVWLCTSPPNGIELSQQWHDISGDSWVVDVRPFRLASLLEASGDDVSWETVAGDFCEVFKYTLKLGDLALSDNWNAYQLLHRRRMIESFGLYRGVEVPADLADSPLSPDLPFIEILLRYHHSESKYSTAAEVHQTHDVTKCSLWPRVSRAKKTPALFVDRVI